MGGVLPSKTCRSCGRSFSWRRKWARDWDEVRYCSAACRRTGVGSLEMDLEDRVLGLLEHRRAGATICPSEVARSIPGVEDWRPLMEPVRRAARRLVAAGRVEILQQGRVVDPDRARGPIRIRRIDPDTYS